MSAQDFERDFTLDLERDDNDPVGELPAGFPPMHSRFPATPSQAFIEAAVPGNKEPYPESDPEVRELIRKQLKKIVRSFR